MNEQPEFPDAYWSPAPDARPMQEPFSYEHPVWSQEPFSYDPYMWPQAPQQHQQAQQTPYRAPQQNLYQAPQQNLYQAPQQAPGQAPPQQEPQQASHQEPLAAPHQAFHQAPFLPQFTPAGDTWDLDGELSRLLAQEAAVTVPDTLVEPLAPAPATSAPATPVPAAPVRPVPSVKRHRRRMQRSPGELIWPALSFAVVLLALVLFVMVSAISGLVTYQPLRTLAAPAIGELAAWWPLLVYGPWTAASLLILRSPTLRGRHARIAWSTLLVFSLVAGALCIVRADKNVSGIAVAALPPLAAMACLQLLLLHLTPSRPRHASPTPRQDTGSSPLDTPRSDNTTAPPTEHAQPQATAPAQPASPTAGQAPSRASTAPDPSGTTAHP